MAIVIQQTETTVLLQKALQELLREQEKERQTLLVELESLRTENALIIQQYHEISEQLTTLQSLINSLKK